MGTPADPEPGFGGAVLPPLPGAAEADRSTGRREVMLAARILDEGSRKGFTHASLPLEAGEVGKSIRSRFLLEHDAKGRVLDVIPLQESQPVVLQWLSRGLVTGHDGVPGWLSVEIVVGR